MRYCDATAAPPTGADMELGAIFPTTEIGNDPVAIRDWAQAAEQLGFRHMIVYDHVLGAVHAGREPALVGPYTEQHPFHEVFVLLAWLAASTKHLELVTGVLVLPQRQTALVAKQAAELDLLSGGRLRLGVGTGWNWVEYDALGVPFEERGRRLDEQVELLRRFWREPLLEFEGGYHRVDRAGILPQPRPDLPIWFGGFSEPAFRRAARVGDGFLHGTSPSRVEGFQRRLQELLQAEGRDPAAFGSEAVVDFSRPESWRSELVRWRELGGTHLSLRAMDTAAAFVGEKHVGFTGPQSYIDALERFYGEVGPLAAEGGSG